MLKMGDGDREGAAAEFSLALAEARRIDPDGPREAEVLNYLALFHEQGGEEGPALKAKEAAQKIFSRFEGLS